MSTLQELLSRDHGQSVSAPEPSSSPPAPSVNPAQLLAVLRRRGFVLSIREDRLLGVTPGELLSEHDRTLVFIHKEALLDLLADEQPSYWQNRRLGWPQDGPNWTGNDWSWQPMTAQGGFTPEQEE